MADGKQASSGNDIMRKIPGTLIEFQSRDGLRLHGFLVRGSSSKKCIIYVHGMTGNFYHHLLPFFLVPAARKDFSFFSMNTRGHDSVAKIYYGRKKKRIIGGTNLEKFEDSVMDIKGAIRALRKLGFKKFVLCGHSTGCQKTAYYLYKTNDRLVAGLILLAPADDYNAQKKELGKKWNRVVNLCKKLVNQGKGNETRKDIPDGFSARRYLSVADLKRVESRLFNYDGPLREFSRLTVPILAVFGSKEQYAVKPVKVYLDLLKQKTHSKRFNSAIVNAGDHAFAKREAELARLVVHWLKAIR